MAETPQQPIPKRHDFQTSADLERVTDYAEEKEISTTDLENVSFILWCCVLFVDFIIFGQYTTCLLGINSYLTYSCLYVS